MKLNNQRTRYYDPLLVINNNQSTTLVLFQGCSSILTKNYSSDKLQDIDNKLPWLMYNTFKENKNYNYIFVNDFFQIYYILNFDDILDSLRSSLRNLNHNRTIYIGTSSGGYGSILFGNLLKADKVLAFSPQISLINNDYIEHNKYRKALYEKYKQNCQYENLAQIQPFGCETTIVYCEQNSFDKKQISLLNKQDKKLKIQAIKCKDHFFEGNKQKIIKKIMEEIND